MRLSDERINHLSQNIVKTLIREGLIKNADESSTSCEVRIMFAKFLKNEEAVDQKVRTKISTIKRNIPEGSKEWDILYEQYYNDEMDKFHV